MASVGTRFGKLYVDFRVDGHRYRENTGISDTPTNRRKVGTLVKKMDAEITLGSFSYRKYFPQSPNADLFEQRGETRAKASDQRVTFAEFCETWFVQKRVEWRKSYADTIRISLDRYLIPEFGNSPVETITKAMMLDFRSSLAGKTGKAQGATMSTSRINHIMTPLRMIITEAADRYAFTNPWQNIKPLKEPRTQVEPFSLDEVNQILTTIRPDFRTYFTARFFTGLRTSEIDGLKWRYVDFERRQILVQEALVQGRMVPTKTDGSQRAVDMSAPVYDALKSQYQRTATLSDFVFCTRTGQPLLNRNVSRRIWLPLLRHLGLRERRLYQTRHTAATLWLAAGENPEWIARQMGHTTTEMLFRVYSRYVPNLTRRDGSAFERLLAAEFSSPEKETHHD
ncbi:MAG: Arm DNA-binding domain-containing protein [Rhodothalassiaceae bacterium]